MSENLILVELKAEGQASVEKEILKVAGAIDTVGEEFENLNNTVDLAKKKLATMKEGSKEFKALQSEIKATEITMKSMGNSASSLKGELRAMKGEIGNMVNALNQMESAGLGGTEQFRILEQQMLETRARAGELSDTIGDISDEISRSGSDTNGLDKTVGALQAVGGAFQAGIGITALFGSENEDLQKTLVKLNAVMAITSGAQQFFTEALKKDSLLYPIVTAGQKAWTLAIGTSTGALRALRTALASIGIGLIIAGIVLLIKYFYEWGESLTVLSEKQKTLNQLSQDVASNVAKETQSLTGLLAILRDENTTREQKNEALRQIREQYPEYLGQLTLENLKTDEGNKLITKQIELLARREQVKKLVEQIAELETKIKIKPDVDLSLLEKAEIFLFEGLTSEKKLGETRNKVFEENIEKQTTALSEEIEKRKALLNELLTAETADALLREGEKNGEKSGEKIGKGIKSGIDKEVVGAFDALNAKIQKAKTLLEDLKTEQVENGKDNTIQIKSLIVELEHYEDVLKRIQNLEISLGVKPFIPQLEEDIEEAGGIQAQVNIKIGSGGIEQELDKESQRAKGRVGEFGIQIGKTLKDKIKEGASNFFDFSRGDDKETKGLKVLQATQELSQGVTNILNQANAIRTQNEIAELEKRKQLGLISEKKYQSELNKIRRKEAERQKKQAVFQALLAVPVAILNALSTGGAKAIPQAIIAGVLAAAQLAIVVGTPLPKFRKGGLIGGKLHTSGGTQIEAERGEFIMKREAVKNHGLKFMESVNNGKLPKFDKSLNGNLPNIEQMISNVIGVQFGDLSDKFNELNGNFAYLEQHLKEGKLNGRESNKYLKTIANKNKFGYA
jgi:hypothetical protein